MSRYDTLNKEQKEAVMHTEGPLLLLAGAGSGKTRVLTHRVAYLIDEVGVNPWHILAITFTNKAAEEMRERVNAIVGFGAEQVWVSTFHSMCVKILRRHIDKLGYDTNFTIYDTDDQKALMRDICKRLMIDTKQIREKSILTAISSAKNELVSPAQYELEVAGDFIKRKIAAAYKEYQAQLRKNNAVDFDDLIMLTVDLLTTFPEIRHNYQERFRYIMVDEYQDTNTAQFELVRLLADGYKNLCVVGDDDQSIYKFRGANIRNILDFEKEYPHAKVIKLEQNYRSMGHILEAANAVIRNNEGRKEKALWTGKEKGNRIHLRQFENAYEEADYISADIRKKVREGVCEYSDVAILYRTNAQSRLLEERFVVDGLPYRIIGGINFYSRAEIKDILAYLKTIDNGRDDVAVKRILNVPKRGIGAASVDKVSEYAAEHGLSFYDALCAVKDIPSLARSAGKIEAFVTLIQSLRAKSQYYGVEDMIKDVVEMVGYEEYIKGLGEEEEKQEERLNNIGELYSKAAAYEKTHDEISLSEFLEEVALVSDVEDDENRENRILLMTLHSAKGLEFPHVYMTGMEDGLFPGYAAVFSPDPTEIEEERRLAYVGITRAMEDLTFTYAKARMLRGEVQYNAISRFVREVPVSIMDNTLPKTARVEESFVESVFDPRPKAVLKKPVTAQAPKPFIAQGIGSLNRIAGISRGSDMVSDTQIDYTVGDRVRHMKYGEGEVISIDREPRDYKVCVKFDEAGQKIMYASFAKLKRV